MGRHFQVEILELTGTGVRVTFPGADYPIEGLGAALEFHDDKGFDYYQAHVLAGPAGDGTILLACLGEPRRNIHRENYRVPTDLTVRLRDQVRVKRYDAPLVNLSLNGCLIQTDADFDFTTLLDLTLSLPGEATCTITAHVMHVVDAPAGAHAGAHIYGLRFVDLAPETDESIKRYIEQRLRELYPSA